MTKIVPKSIAAGVNFTASMWRSEFSGAEWTVVLMARGPASIDLQADRDAARHVWDVPAATTAAWTPGVYAYQVRATNAEGDAFQVEAGTLTITPDLAGLPPGTDMRSQARIALEAIDAVLSKRATLDQERYRINNRELYRTSIADLLKLRSYYAQRVTDESGCGRGRIRDIRVVMRPVGG